MPFLYFKIREVHKSFQWKSSTYLKKDKKKTIINFKFSIWLHFEIFTNKAAHEHIDWCDAEVQRSEKWTQLDAELIGNRRIKIWHHLFALNRIKADWIVLHLTCVFFFCWTGGKSVKNRLQNHKSQTWLAINHYRFIRLKRENIRRSPAKRNKNPLNYPKNAISEVNFHVHRFEDFDNNFGNKSVQIMDFFIRFDGWIKNGWKIE